MIPAPATTRAAAGWHRLDGAAGGLAGDLALYAVAGGFAVLTALTSTLAPHRAWGTLAGYGYATATLLAAAQLLLRRYRADSPLAGQRARAVLTGLAWLLTAVLPLLAQAVQRAAGRTDRAQEEVIVVEQGGARLLDTGTPYLGTDAIAALPADERLLGYLPYQPGMALFGLPRAVAGNLWWTDSRVWFALATAAALLAAVLALRGRVGAAPLVRAVQFATVLPVCTLTLATGGDDLPVLALCLLALALCAAGRWGSAGTAAGAAAALKLFAWPVLVVLLVLAYASGRRPASRFGVAALGLPVVALIPAVLVDAGALVENVVRFPLGHGLVSSPAQSPFPGYLIAAHLPAGRVLAAVLLLGSAAAIGVRLLRRPPDSAASAALVSGYGLLAAILLMPSTRFGYLLYPLALLAWAPALRPASVRPADVAWAAPDVTATGNVGPCR